MKFKNALEEQCFGIARKILGSSVTVEHNKHLEIENALFAELAAFKGPPAKEVDVLVAELRSDPKVMLLVSCKEFSKRAEPAHVQEWAAVTRTMNHYSGGTRYLGLVISPTGFTAGCEPWATSHNVGLIPPLKGRKLQFSPATVLRMFERALKALQVRVQRDATSLYAAPQFFDFVFSLTADFEGHEEGVQDGRYLAFPQKWASSFEEMYASLAGHMVEDIVVGINGTMLVKLSDNVACRFTGTLVEFGKGFGGDPETAKTPICRKNLDGEQCSLDFVKSKAVGTRITSAADFGNYLEFGLDHKFNLGLHVGGVHIVSTENPVEAHNLEGLPLSVLSTQTSRGT